MKLWHDDVRPAPDGWVWVKTNAEAQEILLRYVVLECSLDHDLGGEPDESVESMLQRGDSPNGSGLDLIRWMIAKDCVPPKVFIHSWNPVGAQNMASELRHAGFYPIVAPYEAAS